MAPEPVASAAATPTAARTPAAIAESRRRHARSAWAQPAISSAIRTITWAWRTEAMSISRPL